MAVRARLEETTVILRTFSSDYRQGVHFLFLLLISCKTFAKSNSCRLFLSSLSRFLEVRGEGNNSSALLLGNPLHFLLKACRNLKFNHLCHDILRSSE